MSEIFLSASVPVIGRGTFHESADPFLIQCAVRELFISIARKHIVVWGGHPSITPMVWSICEDLGVDYSKSVILYQSLFYKDRFPEENAKFSNVIFTPDGGNAAASLELMREKMLGRADLLAAVFIGGMEGVKVEYDMFRHLHPNGLMLPVASPGGAARTLAPQSSSVDAGDIVTVDFADLYRRHLGALS